MAAAGITGVRSTMNVWETTYRLLVEELEDLLAPKHGTNELTPEQIARLTAAAYVTGQEHKVNKRGQCRLCRSSSRWWPRGRKPCTVYRVFAVGMMGLGGVVRAWVEDR